MTLKARLERLEQRQPPVTQEPVIFDWLDLSPLQAEAVASWWRENSGDLANIDGSPVGLDRLFEFATMIKVDTGALNTALEPDNQKYGP